MMDAVSQYFTDKEKAVTYFKKIQSDMPRYTRDHLQVIKRALKEAPTNIADSALDFCVKNANYNGHDFENVLFVLWDTHAPTTPSFDIKLLDGGSLEKANETPQAADIDVYQNIVTN